ncbi:asparagine synthetase B family protein [Pectobacteriaceae bacterium CE70]|nr:asparagine synthetase B family protein [Pectobacteriaceae bacterium C52]WJV65682.1 asparagine synthetase B family protein [Pectobacteriaceae bacterium CE70]WJY09703.1 asparagine synthetase B family protein [Pectobacteriaceae bacterium C80]
MSNGFCVIYKGTDADINKLQQSFSGKGEVLHSGYLYIGQNTSYHKFSFEKGTAYLIGTLYNPDFLKTVAGVWDGEAYTANNAALLALLYLRLGEGALAMAEGEFCFLIEDPQGELTLVTDSRGFSPVHVVEAGKNWVTNCLKFVTTVEDENALYFESEDRVCQRSLRADDYTPIKNAQRLKPGSINVITYDSEGYLFNNCKALVSPSSNHTLYLHRKILLGLIERYLTAPLDELSQCYDTVGIPLSGGLDSSLVTAMASRRFKQLNTYSIGTELSNEFTFSQQVADALGTHHQVKILSEAEVINGIIESIYHNEIFDGLSAEIQSGLFNVYRQAQGQVKCMLTGYGSDLLFGGILKPGMQYDNPNQLLSEQVYRTRWTGEFSTHGASHYGIDVRHPFWTNHLIALCHTLEPDYKIYDNEVKNILRDYADTLQLLPKEIVWRKKIGIHEGSSVNQAFANVLGSHVDNYQVKSRFTYRVYKAFLQRRLTIDEVTPSQLSALIN